MDEGKSAMQRRDEILFWRRTDVTGLERSALSVVPDGLLAESSVISIEDGSFRLDHRWSSRPIGGSSR